MSLLRPTRAALFHVRSVVVFLAMSIGITLWMLFGVLGAALSALFERRRSRALVAPPVATQEDAPHVWSLPAWLR